MNKFVQFLTTTVLGGLVVLVPLAIIGYVVGDALTTLIEFTQPLTKSFPFSPLVNALLAAVVAIIAIVLVCFLAGLLVSTLWGGKINGWLESALLEKIPMYTTLRGLTQRFAGFENADYPVVEANLYSMGNSVLGVLVDELPDGRKVVYVPSSPVVTLGQVHILAPGNVVETDLSMAETMGTLSQMGLEAHGVYQKNIRNRSV